MPKKLFDLIIIGAGPAGLSAGIYAARSGLDTIILTKDVGGQMNWSSDIENYPGLSLLKGPELTDKFDDYISEYDNLTLMQGLNGVENTYLDEKVKRVDFNNKVYRSKSVIITAGKKPRHLNIPGEKEFNNKGVAYCTWCDAPLFKGKDVAIIGGGNSAVESALAIASLMNKVYLLTNINHLTAEQKLLDGLDKFKNIEVIYSASIENIYGDILVTGLTYSKFDKPIKLSINAVFVEIGYIVDKEFMDAKLDLNEKNEIIIDSNCNTNIKGVFAAGDITDVSHKQIVIAAGLGATAGIEASLYVTRV